MLPDRYKATASIVQRSSGVIDQSDNVDSITRDLNTLNALVTTDTVLSEAARKVPGTTLDELRDNVSSSVDPNANLIYVTAHDAEAAQSARIANAVSTTSGTVVALGGAGVAVVVRQVLGGGDTTDAVIVLLAAAIYLGWRLVQGIIWGLNQL